LSAGQGLPGIPAHAARKRKSKMSKGCFYRRLERLEARVLKEGRHHEYHIVYGKPDGSVSTLRADGQIVGVVPREGCKAGDIVVDDARDRRPYDRNPAPLSTVPERD
jgi:hypothetical protein